MFCPNCQQEVESLSEGKVVACKECYPKVILQHRKLSSLAYYHRNKEALNEKRKTYFKTYNASPERKKRSQNYWKEYRKSEKFRAWAKEYREKRRRQKLLTKTI